MWGFYCYYSLILFQEVKNLLFELRNSICMFIQCVSQLSFSVLTDCNL